MNTGFPVVSHETLANKNTLQEGDRSFPLPHHKACLPLTNVQREFEQPKIKKKNFPLSFCAKKALISQHFCCQYLMDKGEEIIDHEYSQLVENDHSATCAKCAQKHKEVSSFSDKFPSLFRFIFLVKLKTHFTGFYRGLTANTAVVTQLKLHQMKNFGPFGHIAKHFGQMSKGLAERLILVVIHNSDEGSSWSFSTLWHQKHGLSLKPASLQWKVSSREEVVSQTLRALSPRPPWNAFLSTSPINLDFF